MSYKILQKILHKNFLCIKKKNQKQSNLSSTEQELSKPQYVFLDKYLIYPSKIMFKEFKKKT